MLSGEEEIIHEPIIPEILEGDENFQSMLYSPDLDATNIDKMLSRADSEHTKELIKKEKLERGDFHDLHHAMTSSELKLVNIDWYERSLLGSIFAWACDFVSVAEKLYDFEDDIRSRYAVIKDNKMTFSRADAQEIYEILGSIQKMYTSAMKRVVLTYFYVARSSLSMGGAGFDTVSKQRIEHIGSDGRGIESDAKPNNRFGLFRR